MQHQPICTNSEFVQPAWGGFFDADLRETRAWKPLQGTFLGGWLGEMYFRKCDTRLMEEIRVTTWDGAKKPCKEWDKLPTSTC